MSLHPILALERVIDEYREYLRSEFRAKDPALKQALEQELDRPLFLAQEPFFQANRPFRNGRKWRDLPLDAKLAGVMEARSGSQFAYLHQSQAIEELRSSSARPTVVTTGTGSGKTEAFLLPVIQNAIEDSVRYAKSGLTAILVYPMNALANDQELRIEDYLRGSGFSGSLSVRKYDRGTSQADREELRRNPPHILLTNYMMLEYLLVRPSDREDVFANHRCRFLVLDEVHTYRGTLGTNIALLVRRLRTHLAMARQDWRSGVPDEERVYRFPSLIPIGTSATIRSLAEEGIGEAQARLERDLAVQDFFSRLVGVSPDSIRVIGEEVEEVRVPDGAGWSAQPQALGTLDLSQPDSVRAAICRLAELDSATPLAEAVNKCKILWILAGWLVRTPMSVSQIVSRIKEEVPERAEFSDSELRQEVEAALVLGAALPEDTPGLLRLRVHRIARGGWRFHRCLNPDCGRLYPMGQEQCEECGYLTVPLFLCRNCGAHYLRFTGDPQEGSLRPNAQGLNESEWMLYEYERFDTTTGEEGDDFEENGETGLARAAVGRARPTQMKGRPVLQGSFEPGTCSFSTSTNDYPLRVMLAPARNRCLCCGGMAGSRNVVTPVSLGTSAAVKVMAEGLLDALYESHQADGSGDGKERLLIFSDSRQDAAHQARFILFASRYDRLRRRLTRILSSEGPLSIQRAVELLGAAAVTQRDNPYAPQDEDQWISDEGLQKIRIWEEAPLLDELAVTAGYRGTLFNLGLGGLQYQRLDEYVLQRGGPLAELLGLPPSAVTYFCRCLLDEIRTKGALSREILRYHTQNPSCPSYFRSAEWERKFVQPQGYPVSTAGQALAYLDRSQAPQGIKVMNAWRRPGTGGRGPSLERILRRLAAGFGGRDPDDQMMTALLDFLLKGQFLVASELFGYRERGRLLQVNSEAIRIGVLSAEERVRCDVCGSPRPYAPLGSPCPLCRGQLVAWPTDEVDQNRTVRRIRAEYTVPLFAGEHTAQVPNETRIRLEESFKAPPAQSAVNVLACSPTLEMGIDVGGLDAVALRNIPPRPDNYAQRGGRAGRRSRIGLVLGYARSTPHDQYFFDRPAEMIAGEVAAPALALSNRDALLRHLNAILFSLSSPGLSGRMVDYVSPQGELKEDAIAALIEGLSAQAGSAVNLARESFGDAVLEGAGLGGDALQNQLQALPDRVRDVFARTARQVIELRQALDTFSRDLEGRSAATRAAELVARLLGIPTEPRWGGNQADDRSAGYPLRRFAEFGLLPGYEFPTEPAALRLLGDSNEEEPVSVARRFGIDQFRPDAQVYARTKRWRVIGLDNASPWNPRSEAPGWTYRVCGQCSLRFRGDRPRCPRCADDSPGRPVPVGEYGGFLARRDESPVLDEEERYAVRALVQSYPQWDGDVVGRWTLPGGGALRLSRGEEVQWLNEGSAPTPRDFERGVPILHGEAKGYLLCGLCGRVLTVPETDDNPRGGRRRARANSDGPDPYGHGDSCPQRGTPPRAVALGTAGRTEVLRLLAPVPPTYTGDSVRTWGLSLGYALRTGLRRLYMLEGSEIDFELEGPWKTGADGLSQVALSFIDPSLGGTGYLQRAAGEFHLVARQTLVQLDHTGCETACYRCLKSYANQRFHDFLRWPIVWPDLETIASAPPTARPRQTGDIDDPQPWLDAYAAGVGSPLELRFLRLFEQYGFSPERQVQIRLSPEQPPISIADFAVPDRRLAVYIDGAAFHTGSNLRRDRYIRDRLRQADPPWTVVELRASDLQRGRDLVAELAGLA